MKNNGFKHGMCGTPTYHCWEAIKQRCFNKNHPAFKYYGDRGITLDKSWLKFENFFKDMGTKPEDKSIDRIDNNKGYSKENCHWITIQEQQKNRRDNCEFVGVNYESQRKAWHVQITFKGIKHFLGRFKDYSKAKKAREKAEKELWYARV